MAARRHPAWPPAPAGGRPRLGPRQPHGRSLPSAERTASSGLGLGLGCMEQGVQRAAGGHWAPDILSHVPHARHSRVLQGVAACHSRRPRMRPSSATWPCPHVNATAGSSAAASSAALAVRLVTPPV